MTDTPTPRLTIRGLTARPVLLPLERPVVARIATITEWPIVLIDLETEEGIVGRSYLEPYIPKAMRYLVPALQDLGELLRGQPVVPVDLYTTSRKSLHFVGYEGLSAIAVSGVDMAAWDALAKAAGQPLCVLLGGSVAPVRAYNSNGLWLHEPAAVADEALALREEGGFEGLKLRMGRTRLRDDLAALEAVRRAVGRDMHLMVDFNQGLDLAEAPRALPRPRRSRPDLDRRAGGVRRSGRLPAPRGRARHPDSDRRELLRPPEPSTAPCRRGRATT